MQRAFFMTLFFGRAPLKAGRAFRRARHMASIPHAAVD